MAVPSPMPDVLRSLHDGGHGRRIVRLDMDRALDAAQDGGRDREEPAEEPAEELAEELA